MRLSVISVYLSVLIIKETHEIFSFRIIDDSRQWPQKHSMRLGNLLRWFSGLPDFSKYDTFGNECPYLI
jgi:hypothetical protein